MANGAIDLFSAFHEICIDGFQHSCHCPRRCFLGVLIGCKIALHVAIGALYSQRLIKVLHDETNVGFRIQKFQILRRQGSRAAAARLLSQKGN